MRDSVNGNKKRKYDEEVDEKGTSKIKILEKGEASGSNTNEMGNDNNGGTVVPEPPLTP